MIDMKIGFDLDGVLCEINVAFLRMIDNFPLSKEKIREISELWYYREVKPLLNPIMIMAPNDKGYIITSRMSYLREITEEWVKKYCPNLELHLLGLSQCPDNPKEVKAWINNMTECKAKKIKELGIELFIDDSPEVVIDLRKLGVVALQWGGRLPVWIGGKK